MARLYIPKAKVKRIRKMLSKGVPIIQIARKVGVSRSTIYKVRGVVTGSADRERLPKPEARGKEIRCTGCGVMVYGHVPCLECRIRN